MATSDESMTAKRLSSPLISCVLPGGAKRLKSKAVGTVHGQALAQEGAGKGITVNAIAPGYIATEMVRAVPATCWKKLSHASRSAASVKPARSPVAWCF
jgi:hypothetical protein